MKLLTMVIGLIILPACFITSGNAMGRNPAGEVTVKVREFFGEEIIDIIINPDRVLSYRVNPRKSKAPSHKNLYNYPVVGKGPELSSKQTENLQLILLDEKTYNFKWAKREFIFPEYALIFQQGEKSLTLFVDFYRKEFMFVYKGRELVEDFDSAHDKIKSLINELFIK